MTRREPTPLQVELIERHRQRNSGRGTITATATPAKPEPKPTVLTDEMIRDIWARWNAPRQPAQAGD